MPQHLAGLGLILDHGCLLSEASAADTSLGLLERRAALSPECALSGTAGGEVGKCQSQRKAAAPPTASSAGRWSCNCRFQSQHVYRYSQIQSKRKSVETVCNDKNHPRGGRQDGKARLARQGYTQHRDASTKDYWYRITLHNGRNVTPLSLRGGCRDRSEFKNRTEQPACAHRSKGYKGQLRVVGLALCGSAQLPQIIRLALRCRRRHQLWRRDRQLSPADWAAAAFHFLHPWKAAPRSC